MTREESLAVWSVFAAASAGMLITSGFVWWRLGRSAPRRQVGLLAAAGAFGLASVLLRWAAGAGTVRELLWIGTGYFCLPVALALYPDDRPADGLGWLSLVPIVAVGGLAVAYPAMYAESGLAGMVDVLVLAAIVWWRFERADEPGRRTLLWLVLGTGPGLVVGALSTFSVRPALAAVVLTLVVVVLLGCLAIGLVAPGVRDVRAVCVTVVVHLVTWVLVIAVYAMVLAAVDVAGQHPATLSPGTLGVIAAICAIGYAPTVRLLSGVVDRLLFGERRNPIDAATRAGERLEDDPVLALRSLRESLALPYAALLEPDGSVVAVTGAPVTEVVRHQLTTGGVCVGELAVGLRAGELALSRKDRDVLTVLTPALAQLMRARTLSAEVQASRSGMVRAAEEERRRLRRDLHDGLGPRLTGVAYTADAARNLLRADPDRADELLTTLRADASEAIAEVRRLVDGLRPPSLDQVGLLQSLRQVSRHVLRADGRRVDIAIDAPAVLPPLGAAVEVAAYRIVVEALTNVARHSTADRVQVSLAVEDGTVLISVDDNGDANGEWRPGVGLGSMRERAELLGGTFSAGGGTVAVTLPIGLS